MALMLSSSPFLQLPAELRILIYENLAPHTRHYRSKGLTQIELQQAKECGSAGTVTLVIKSVPTAILATCRLVHQEALPILLPHLRRLLPQSPKIIVSTAALFGSYLQRSILGATSAWFATLNKDSKHADLKEQKRTFQELMARRGLLESAMEMGLPLDDVCEFIQKAAKHLLAQVGAGHRPERPYMEIAVIACDRDDDDIIRAIGWHFANSTQELRFGLRLTTKIDLVDYNIHNMLTRTIILSRPLSDTSEIWRSFTEEDEELGEKGMVAFRDELGKWCKTEKRELQSPVPHEIWIRDWSESS